MKLPAFKPTKLIALFQKAGYFIDHQTGSHIILLNNKGQRLTIPRHNRDLKKGTLSGIIKQSGFSRKDFIKLLRKK